MMFKRSIVVLGLMGLVACSQNSPPSNTPGGAAPTGQPATTAAPVAYNIGDVETSIRLTATIAEKSRGDSVRYNELENKRGDLAMAEAHITKPYPDELWVDALIETKRGLRPGDSHLFRLRVYAEGIDEPIAEKEFVWEGSERSRPKESLEVDLMELKDTLSDSVLLHARTKILWFSDTEAESIDPENLTQTPTSEIEKLSNTLRITFQ